ncbi:putative bifunctional diguanylate cyclase/phosphodiesterase [Pseudonocardia humida]|uniref:EAL domain-containing protein n=1 Tax=Pseudonocardia humida TaxID=2800819 RepID=A0ABT1A3B9_9PSEU|nr:EAL domain-containing protein [Pseudonocardia humida]MCO1657497.1 EAL domain-containing protein [Pseudonocardia humida]
MSVVGAPSAADIAERASIGLVVVRDGTVRWCNPAAREMVEGHGGCWDGDRPVADLREGIRPGAGDVTVRWPAPDGSTRWWQVSCTVLEPDAGSLLYEITDRTARFSLERRLGVAVAEWRLSRFEALARMGSWVWNVENDRLELSETLLVAFGLPPRALLDLDGFRAQVHPDDLTAVNEVLAAAVRTGRDFTHTHRMFVAGHSTARVFECRGEVFSDASGRPIRVLGTARDVTEEHRARTELAFLAEHDPLTGIANRRRITARLAECLADPAGATLLLIDIDRFKDVNDLRGHAVGDRVIRRVADVVPAHLEPGALIGRLGGDEFAVVLPRRDPEDGLVLGERLCDAVAGQTIAEGDSALTVTVSIGVAAGGDGADVEVLLARADLALYAAKAAGRNRARLFAPDQYRRAVARVGLLKRVGDALDQETMQLDAQPIVELATGRARRSELLIRLRDGLVPDLRPVDFLPAAERGDLVLRLDRWVLARAVRALAGPAARARRLRLEVNISARSLEDDELGDWVLAELAGHDVEPCRLGLEMTETTAVTNLDAAKRLVGRLTEAGCGFSLDDFGAGFASFSHLKHLPFTAVKIAGEFVRGLDTDPVDRALVSAVVGVAGELGMRTVAEHVDRPELVERLRELGVHDGQGYHLGRPRPLAELLG